MSKVDFTYVNGKVKPMKKVFADVLEKLGHGTYQTRDMVAARPEPLLDRQMTAEPRRRGRPPGVKPVDPAPVVEPTPEPVVPVELATDQATTEDQEPKSEE